MRVWTLFIFIQFISFSQELLRAGDSYGGLIFSRIDSVPDSYFPFIQSSKSQISLGHSQIYSISEFNSYFLTAVFSDWKMGINIETAGFDLYRESKVSAWKSHSFSQLNIAISLEYFSQFFKNYNQLNKSKMAISSSYDFTFLEIAVMKSVLDESLTNWIISSRFEPITFHIQFIRNNQGSSRVVGLNYLYSDQFKQSIAYSDVSKELFSKWKILLNDYSLNFVLAHHPQLELSYSIYLSIYF